MQCCKDNSPFLRNIHEIRKQNEVIHHCASKQSTKKMLKNVNSVQEIEDFLQE